MAAIQAVITERKARGLRRPWLAVSCAVSALNQDEVENLVRWLQDYDIDNLSFGYLHFSTPNRQQATEGQVDGPVRRLKDHELPDRIRRRRSHGPGRARRQDQGRARAHASP